MSSIPLSQQAAEALEVAHALDMVTSLPSYTDDTSLPAVVQVACLESYFTNLRVLIEFLGVAVRKNSIKAADFVPGWTYPASQKAQHLKTVEYGFASEQVSHLAKSRVAATPGDVVNVHPSKLLVLALIVVEVFEDDFLPRLKSNGSAQLATFDNALQLARARLAQLFS